MGRIITFYSFKGGVGRSMSLANLAVLLANWGYKVLAIDFDLEAPGLENFFTRNIDLNVARDAQGVVDLLSDAALTGTMKNVSEWEKHTLEIKLPRMQGELRLLTSGRRCESYFKRVQKLDFEEFYSVRNGGALIERFRQDLKTRFDFVLVDSRTGFTDIGGVCTVQLPDSIVLLFTATNQGLQGGIEMVERAGSARQRLPFERPAVPVIPVPSRLDMSAEFRLTQRWLDTFSQDLSKVVDDWMPRAINLRSILELLKLPHVSFFSYGESLPVLEQGTTDPGGLGYAYETLASLLAHDLQNIELLISDRGAYVKEVSKSAPEITKEKAQTSIFVSYSHKDLRWLEELQLHLAPLIRSRALVLELWDDRRITLGAHWQEEIQRALSDAALAIIIVSPDYLASEYLQRVELPSLLTAAHDRGLPIAWIAARSSSFSETPIARFQALNDPSRPLAKLSENRRDEVMVSVARRIAEMAGQSY